MQRFWIGVIGVLVLLVGLVTARWYSQQAELQSAYLLPAPRVVKTFSLQDPAGTTVDQAQLRGKWTLVFVGYTSCPDICPMTMAMLAGAYPQLQQTAGEVPVQVWFVSVDPQRDTPSQLQQYMAYFQQPALTALTGRHDQLYPFVRELDLMYAIATDTSQADYRVDHSASIAIINPQAEFIGSFRPDMNLEGAPPLVSRAKLLADFAMIAKTGR